MTQKVQRWSQPFCTCRKARVSAIEVIDHLRRGLAHAHDVVDADTFGRTDAEVGIGAGAELFLVAEHRVHFRHGGVGLGLGLRRAAGDDDAPRRVFAPALADRLARLAHGFVRSPRRC